jgi:SAM-dependent methyltransferase
LHHAHLDLNYPLRYATHIRQLMPFYGDMIAGVAKALAPYSGESVRVVELGCGNGELSQRLFESGATIIVGVDYSEPVLQYVRRRFASRLGSTFFTVEGDICDSSTWADPALRQPADLVVASLIFHDLETTTQRKRLLADVVRVLRSGGIFCFADPLDDGIDLEGHLDQWTACMLLQPNEVSSLRDDDPRMFSPLPRAELHQLAAQVGLCYEGRYWSHLHFSVELFRKR